MCCCESCESKNAKYYEIRCKMTDNFLFNMYLCDECAESYEEEFTVLEAD